MQPGIEAVQGNTTYAVTKQSFEKKLDASLEPLQRRERIDR
jgi:hypothetical protein